MSLSKEEEHEKGIESMATGRRTEKGIEQREG
jgi:hypothetical protein